MFVVKEEPVSQDHGGANSPTATATDTMNSGFQQQPRSGGSFYTPK